MAGRGRGGAAAGCRRGEGRRPEARPAGGGDGGAGKAFAGRAARVQEAGARGRERGAGCRFRLGAGKPLIGAREA